jgi:putative ABC transport system permease protein
MIHIIRSVRLLRKHWKLTAVAIFSLSVAMVLGVVALSITNTFLLLAPAAADADRLVMIYSRSPGEDIAQFSYPDYQYYRENNHVFTDVAANPISIGVTTDFNEAHEVKVVERPASDNYFSVLGIHPYLGQFFSSGDDSARKPIAVMTYGCWMRLGADPNIVGKTVAKNTIVGVAPKEYTGSLYGLNGDLLTPLTDPENDSSWLTRRDVRHLSLIARLKPGITKRQAQAEMSALSAQLASAYPKEDKNRVAIVTRATLLPPDAIPAAELILGILVALVVLVLLIACANVANLLLAVAVGRRQEAAIKLALGAPRGRLIREFLKESTIICAASAALGYFIASTLIARYSQMAIDLPGLGAYSLGLNLRVDAAVLALTLVLMLIAIVATGVAPALYASSPNLGQILGGEIVVGGTRRSVRRNVLVIAQVAVCTLVLVGMGLCERSLYNLRHSDPGFSARNLVSAAIYPRQPDTTPAIVKQLNEAVRDAVSRLPGVESVSLSRDALLESDDIEAQVPDSDNKIFVRRAIVDGNYFPTLGIRILAGRVFNSTDRENSQQVVVINRKMAETFWPGQDAVGKVLVAGDPPQKAIVAGVVADSKSRDVDEPTHPVLYYPLSQHYQPRINVIARTSGDPRLWVEPIHQTMRALGLYDGMRPVTLNEWIDFDLLTKRITAAFATILSGLGLLLATLGLFGAISYSVSERKKEFGIRVALGARRRELLAMVLRQTFFVAGTGVALGIVLGVGATILLRAQFYGIGRIEWSVLLPVSAGMETVSLVVAYLSAQPWITMDPMEAVRHA